MRAFARRGPSGPFEWGCGLIRALSCATALAALGCQAPQPAAPAGALTLRSANVRLAALPPPWVRLDERSFDPEAVAVFMRTAPEVFFSVAAESVGEQVAGAAETLAEVARGRVASRSTSLELLESAPHELRGLSGRRIVMAGHQGGRKVHTVIWAFVLHGFRYQLTVWGAEPLATRSQTLAAADAALAAFDVLDRARVSRVGAHSPAPEFRSARYGYVVAAASGDWHDWADAHQSIPGVEHGLALGERGSLVVLPIRLFGRDPDIEALAAGLLDRVDIELQDGGLSPCQPFEAGLMRGCDYRLRRGGAVASVEFRIRVAKGGGAAFLVAAWVEQGADLDSSQEAATALASVHLGGAGVLRPGELNAEERRTHGEVFNQIGLWLFDRGRYDEALSHFRLAFELEGTDPTFLGNVVETYAAAGRSAEALRYLNLHIAGFPEDADLQHWHETLVEDLEAQARVETWS
jgi:tetratricopeptide (TPR) repeat protein